ncbi:MAG: Y-family DNA polymerase [Magnetovibrionaceae bacterium]
MEENKKRILSLHLPFFATDRLMRRWPEMRGRALATVRPEKGGLRLGVVNAQGLKAGAEPDQPVAAARAVAPMLLTVPEDRQTDELALNALADWCLRYTPWTATDGRDGLVLDITGCAHLLGGEEALRGDLCRRLGSMGFQGFRLAVAETRGAAWGLARYARMGASGLSAAPGTLREALKPLPIQALRLEETQIEGLHRLGLRHIGDLAGRPRGPLAARFGAGLILRLDQAFGAVEEPVSPKEPVPERRVRLSFADPIGNLDDIKAGCEELLAELCQALETAGLGARRLDLDLCHSDGRVTRFSLGTAQASREPSHLMRLFQGKLKGFEAGFGVDAMVLSCPAAEPYIQDQGTFGRLRDEAPISPLIDRLTGRLGRGHVLRLSPLARHRPEHSQSALPALDGLSKPPEGYAPRHLIRPMELIDPPEPVRVEAHGSPPLPRCLIWRRRHHRLVRVSAPERIGPEWWREGASLAELRDYHRVEDDGGRRFWLFHAPLERPARWYLHGVLP